MDDNIKNHYAHIITDEQTKTTATYNNNDEIDYDDDCDNDDLNESYHNKEKTRIMMNIEMITLIMTMDHRKNHCFLCHRHTNRYCTQKNTR